MYCIINKHLDTPTYFGENTLRPRSWNVTQTLMHGAFNTLAEPLVLILQPLNIWLAINC